MWDWQKELNGLSRDELLKMAKEYSILTTPAADIVVDCARGSSIWEVGNDLPYLDFNSSVGSSNLGYGNPEIIYPFSRYLSENGILNYSHHDFYSKAAVILEKKLCEITPGQFRKKVFLSNSGTEAVEAAIKMCLKLRSWRKSFLAFNGAFHGRTGFSLALNASKPIHTRDFPKAFKVHHLTFPEQGNARAVALFLRELDNLAAGEDHHDINAAFIELVQGEGGINVVDPNALFKFREVLKDLSIYLIVDEVQTGMMRTGKMFACEHYSVEPDIICLGKSLASGAPIGATVAKAEFDFPIPGCHSTTFGGNNVAAVPALQTIAVMEQLDQRILEQKIKMLSGFSQGGLGMMRRIICRSGEERDQFIKKAFERRLLLLGAGERNIRLMPPLVISELELDKAHEIICACCQC